MRKVAFVVLIAIASSARAFNVPEQNSKDTKSGSVQLTGCGGECQEAYRKYRQLFDDENWDGKAYAEFTKRLHEVMGPRDTRLEIEAKDTADPKPIASVQDWYAAYHSREQQCGVKKAWEGLYEMFAAERKGYRQSYARARQLDAQLLHYVGDHKHFEEELRREYREADFVPGVDDKLSPNLMCGKAAKNMAADAKIRALDAVYLYLGAAERDRLDCARKECSAPGKRQALDLIGQGKASGFAMDRYFDKESAAAVQGLKSHDQLKARGEAALKDLKGFKFDDKADGVAGHPFLSPRLRAPAPSAAGAGPLVLRQQPVDASALLAAMPLPAEKPASNAGKRLPPGEYVNAVTGQPITAFHPKAKSLKTAPPPAPGASAKKAEVKKMPAVGAPQAAPAEENNIDYKNWVGKADKGDISVTEKWDKKTRKLTEVTWKPAWEGGGAYLKMRGDAALNASGQEAYQIPGNSEFCYKGAGQDGGCYKAPAQGLSIRKTDSGVTTERFEKGHATLLGKYTPRQEHRLIKVVSAQGTEWKDNFDGSIKRVDWAAPNKDNQGGEYVSILGDGALIPIEGDRYKVPPGATFIFKNASMPQSKSIVSTCAQIIDRQKHIYAAAADCKQPEAARESGKILTSRPHGP